MAIYDSTITSGKWQGIVNQMTVNIYKDVIDTLVRKNFLLSWLDSKGRVANGEDGWHRVWTALRSEATVQPLNDGQAIIYQRHDGTANYNIPNRSLILPDSYTYLEKKETKGAGAVYRRYERIGNKNSDTMRRQICKQLYSDGVTNTSELYGLMTPMGEGTVGAGDLIATNNGAYGGHDTDLAQNGSTWSNDASTSPNSTLANDYPFGSGDAEYRWNAPLLVNTSSTAWGASTGWKYNAAQILQTTNLWLGQLNGETEVDAHILSSMLFDEYLTNVKEKFRLTMPHKRAIDLGFDKAVGQDGVAVHPDYHCPAGEGFSISAPTMALYSLDTELIDIIGPDWDQSSFAWTMAHVFTGNVLLTPCTLAHYKARA